MKFISTVLLTGLLAGAATAGSRREKAVSTKDGKGADAQISPVAEKCSGDGPTAAAKHTIHHKGWAKVYLRFDLAGRRGRRKINPRYLADARLVLKIDTKHAALIDNWSYNIFVLKELSGFGKSRDGKVKKLSKTWAEGEINWQNAPANDELSSGGAFDADADERSGGVLLKYVDFAGTLTLKQGDRGPYEFSSKEFLEILKRRKGPLISIIITRVDQHNNVVPFATKENEAGPAPSLLLTEK